MVVMPYSASQHLGFLGYLTGNVDSVNILVLKELLDLLKFRLVQLLYPCPDTSDLCDGGSGRVYLVLIGFSSI